MKILYLITTFILTLGLNFSMTAQTIYYVGDGGMWSNWDIYSFDLGTGIETRLTTNPAIDNHPVVAHFDSTRVCFSSNRDGLEFEIYVADVSDIDSTAVRLTFNQGYPDRHPHWHPTDSLIIFTSKDRPVTTTVVNASECSQPIITHVTRYFEGMNLIDLEFPAITIPIVVQTAWDTFGDPTIWVLGDSVYVGHPSFNHDGDLLVFTASIDGDGKVWEVYTAGFDSATHTLVPHSLKRITHGPDIGSNPIKMSGGAVFSHDGTEILLNSTRTTGGNSQIFSVPASSEDLVLSDIYRRTWHNGNDYVPEPINDDDILISSDLGLTKICNCDSFPGATPDLDVVLIENWATRSVVGVDSVQETLLLSDEVSWFCGLKPNLSTCTFMPKIMCTEAIWLETNPVELLPQNLLEGYGPQYANNAWNLYLEGQGHMWNFLGFLNPAEVNQIDNEMNQLWATWPGYGDSIQLQNWLDNTQHIRRRKHVMPTLMFEYGLGNGCDGLDCPDSLIVNGLIGSGLFEAGIVVSSSGVIDSANTTIFNAGDHILLDLEFEVRLGADFETLNLGCFPSVFSKKSKVTGTPNKFLSKFLDLK